MLKSSGMMPKPTSRMTTRMTKSFIVKKKVIAEYVIFQRVEADSKEEARKCSVDMTKLRKPKNVESEVMYVREVKQ